MPEQTPLREKGRAGPRSFAWLALACAGIGLMALGIKLDEPGKIFEKATAICLQCIGIG